MGPWRWPVSCCAHGAKCAHSITWPPSWPRSLTGTDSSCFYHQGLGAWGNAGFNCFNLRLGSALDTRVLCNAGRLACLHGADCITGLFFVLAPCSGRRFLDTHVAQMLYVVPHILTVEPVLRQRSDSSPVSSNSRLSRFGASQWDLNISLAQPPLRSSLDQQAVAAGPAAEAGNDSAFTNVGWPSQRLGKHDGGGVPGLGGSGSTLLASESKDPAHARTGVEALQGNQSSGASQEVKRRRLFPQEADTTGLSREPQGLRPVAEHGVVEGGEGGVRGAGAMRRLSDAEAMVWRKREFRRALQDLHRSMPLVSAPPQHAPSAPPQHVPSECSTPACP